MNTQIKDPLNPLSASQRANLNKANKLLICITIPGIAAKAAEAGYNDEEHEVGWRLLNQASGRNRPFSHFLSEALRRLVIEQNVDLRSKYRSLDAFENRWFKRTRVGIRRHIDPDHRQAIEAALFHDLSQQPEGPKVVGSVGTFLKRLEGLAASGSPGVGKLMKSLEGKGLTEEHIITIRAILSSFEQAPPSEDRPAAISQAELHQAALVQIDAYENLMAFYNEWAITLRDELDHNDLIRIGLRQPPRRPSPPIEAEEAEQDAPVESEDGSSEA